MKIAIIGSGGVGGYFGAKLAKAGFEVTFFARGNHLKALKENGLTLKSIQGDISLEKVNATDTIAEIPKPDLIIVALKAWQLRDIAQELSGIIKDTTVILPLQNGVIATDELNSHLPEKHLLSGLCRILSKIESPGVINHFGVDPLIVFGELNNAKTKRILEIKAAFDKVGFKSRIADDIQAELWKKFISICVSGLLAITRSSYGEVLACAETRKLLVGLLTEIYQLSQKMGIALETDLVDKTVAYLEALPYESNSSLARDVWEGKPSEIEYQNGTVVKLAEKYGLETPINRFIYSCILPMEIRARATK